MLSSFFGGGVSSQQRSTGAASMNVFLRSYKAYSPAFFGKPEINRGNKIILPSSALHELARLSISYPMIFMISNP